MWIDLEIEFWVKNDIDDKSKTRDKDIDKGGNSSERGIERARDFGREQLERRRARERFEAERLRFLRRGRSENRGFGFGFGSGLVLPGGKMSRGQRYEPLPQREEHTTHPIILSPIPNYNYNSGIPTSAAPSVISIPNSPPPSFHTTSSPGTPRPSQAQLNLHNHVYNNGLRGGGGGADGSVTEAELWGIAPSTVGGETLDGGLASSNDVLDTIKGLRQRVEWLEESMGRLLLEKEKATASEETYHERNNCCVSFTDASPDLERALLSPRAGSNCCVSFSGSHRSDAKRREQRLALAAFLLFTFVICITVGVVMTARAGRVNRAVNGAVDGVAKFLE